MHFFSRRQRLNASEMMRDPYVQFVLHMTAECAQSYPHGEDVFAAFFIEWLRVAMDRTTTE